MWHTINLHQEWTPVGTYWVVIQQSCGSNWEGIKQENKPNIVIVLTETRPALASPFSTNYDHACRILPLAILRITAKTTLNRSLLQQKGGREAPSREPIGNSWDFSPCQHVTSHYVVNFCSATILIGSVFLFIVMHYFVSHKPKPNIVVHVRVSI